MVASPARSHQSVAEAMMTVVLGIKAGILGRECGTIVGGQWGLVPL